MQKIYLIFAFALLFSYNNQAFGQCGCTNCPLTMPDGAVEDFFVNVFDAGGADCNLATNPLDQVIINFNHEYLGDLTITLTSPGGQTITLVGPEGLSGGTDNNGSSGTGGDIFNATFDDAAATTWDSDIIAPPLNDNTLETVTGTYKPSIGALSSFTGSLCGTWTLNVSDGQAYDGGQFQDIQLVFTNPPNLVCNSEAPPSPCPTVDFTASNGSGNVGAICSGDAVSWTTGPTCAGFSTNPGPTNPPTGPAGDGLPVVDLFYYDNGSTFQAPGAFAPN